MERRPASPTPELAAHLAQHERVFLMGETNLGTAFILKLPTADIETMRGDVPMQLSHWLFRMDQGPVVRTVLTVFDRPDNPLQLETFTNVEDEQQRDEYAALTEQDSVVMLLYNEKLELALAKRVTHSEREGAQGILKQAEEWLAMVPEDERDFMAAKARVMEVTGLP